MKFGQIPISQLQYITNIYGLDQLINCNANPELCLFMKCDSAYIYMHSRNLVEYSEDQGEQVKCMIESKILIRFELQCQNYKYR